ncbi:MAG: hypothetical protein HY722_12310 [Planctomycetes bacterium]|nr:hypothetical protein [Planctomycetota bacterium]
MSHRALAAPSSIVLVLAVLAAAAAVRAEDPIRDLEKDLKAALSGGDVKVVGGMVEVIVRHGGEEAAGLLLKYVERMPEGADRYYWTLVGGAAAFTDPAGLGAVGEWVLRNKGAAGARDVLFALRDNGSRAYARALEPVLEKGPFDLQVMVAEHLGELDYAESIDVLLAALKREEGRNVDLAARIVRAMEGATGEVLGDRPGAWESWWALNRKDSFRKPRGEGGTGTATDVLDPIRTPVFEKVRELDPERIVVVKEECEPCNFDKIQEILERMKVPHKLVTKKEFAADTFSMKGRIALLLNCTQIKEHCICPTCKPTGATNMRLKQCGDCNVHDIISHAFDAKAVQKIKAFVEAGGYLFTEDWGLPEVLEKAWPSLVKAGEFQKEQEVDVVPSRGMTSHPLLKGVFQRPEDERHKGGDDGGEGGTVVGEPEGGTEDPDLAAQHAWTIDDDSPTIRAVGKTVSVLLVSPKLRESVGEAHEPVAVTFLAAGERDDIDRRPRTGGTEGHGEAGGKGRVLHVLSHFGKQGSTEDEYALQNLLINFLLEARRRVGAAGVR